MASQWVWSRRAAADVGVTAPSCAAPASQSAERDRDPTLPSRLK